MTDRAASGHGVAADASSFWGQRLSRSVSADEGRAIAENVCGFFTVLAEWAEAEVGTRRETPNSEARPPPRAHRPRPNRESRRRTGRHGLRVAPSAESSSVHLTRSNPARET